MMMRTMGFILLLAIQAVGLSRTMAQDWKRDFYQKMNSSEVTLQAQAVRELAQRDTKEAAEILFKQVLFHPQIGDALKRSAVESFALFHHPEAIAWLTAQLSRAMSWPDKVLLLEALSSIRDTGVATALLKELKNNDPRCKAAAINALGKNGDPRAIEALTKELSSSANKTHWQVLVACCEALAELKAVSSTPALVEQLQKGEGRLKGDALRALEKISGQFFGDSPLNWLAWHKTQSSGSAPSPPEQKKQPQPQGQSRALYYGIRLDSNRLVFILDISGSMNSPLLRGSQVAVSGSPGAEGPAKAQTKIALAKTELVRTIRELQSNAAFTLIFYNSSVNIWNAALIPANAQNKQAAIAAVEKLTANGGTNIYQSLEKAFLLGHPGGHPTTSDTAYLQGVDTIFFLTDGFPSDGPPPFDKSGSAIADEVQKWNRIRKIRLNTVGVGPHDASLLKRLAEESGGQYVAVGR